MKEYESSDTVRKDEVKFQSSVWRVREQYIKLYHRMHLTTTRNWIAAQEV